MGGVFLVGRVLLGGYLIYAGLNHFARLGTLAQVVEGGGVPIPTLAVALSGALLLIAGVSFLLGVLPRLGVAALALFLVPVTIIMHAFWSETDPTARMMQLGQFAKNFALLGAGLMSLAIPEPWPLSLRLRVPREATAT